MAQEHDETRGATDTTGFLEKVLTAGLFLAAAPVADTCGRFPWLAVTGAVLCGGLLPADRWYWRLTRRGLLSVGFWLILLPALSGPAAFGWPAALALSGWTFMLGRIAAACPRTGGHRAAMILAGLGELTLLAAAGTKITDPASGRLLIAVGLYAVGWRLILGLPEAALAALAPALAAMFIRLLALAGTLPADYLSGSGGPEIFAGGLALFIAAEQALSREREYPFRDFVFWRGLLPMLAPAWLWTPLWSDSHIFNIARLLPGTLTAGGLYIIAGTLTRAPVSRGVGRVMWWTSLAGLASLARFGGPAIGTIPSELPMPSGFVVRPDIGTLYMAAVLLSLAGLLLSATGRQPPSGWDFTAWAVAGFAFRQFGAWLPEYITFPGSLAGCVTVSLAASRHRLYAHRAAWTAGILLPALWGWDARQVLTGLVLAAASLLPGVIADLFAGSVPPNDPDPSAVPPASPPTSETSTI